MIKDNQLVLFRGKYIDAKELSKGSNKEIIYICDFCGDEFIRKVKERERIYKNSKIDSCRKCSIKNREITNLRKFGVKYPAQSKDILSKMERTMIDRYGVKNPMESQKFIDKIAETKIKNGTYNSGAKHIIINGVFASKPQINLGKKLDGKINYNLFGKFVDIVLIDCRIAIEYDGSGHRLSVKRGAKTDDEFNRSEEMFEVKLLENGWRFIRITNTKDLPLDYDRIHEQIIKFIEEDRYYLHIKIS